MPFATLSFIDSVFPYAASYRAAAFRSRLRVFSAFRLRSVSANGRHVQQYLQFGAFAINIKPHRSHRMARLYASFPICYTPLNGFNAAQISASFNPLALIVWTGRPSSSRFAESVFVPSFFVFLDIVIIRTTT